MYQNFHVENKHREVGSAEPRKPTKYPPYDIVSDGKLSSC